MEITNTLSSFDTDSLLWIGENIASEDLLKKVGSFLVGHLDS